MSGDNGHLDESMVKVPPYYRFGAQCEQVFDITDALDLNYNVGCVIKYAVRAGRKPGEPATKAWRKCLRCAARELRRLGGDVPEDL